jgi:hypothetical protein
MACGTDAAEVVSALVEDIHSWIGSSLVQLTGRDGGGSVQLSVTILFWIQEGAAGICQTYTVVVPVVVVRAVLAVVVVETTTVTVGAAT